MGNESAARPVEVAPIPVDATTWNARRVATIAVFIALAGVGAIVPIPSPTGTIALDAAPGYFMALYGGPVNGGIVSFVGHILVATRAGWPLGVIVHLGIGLALAGAGAGVWLTYYYSRNLILAIVVGIILNTFGTNIMLTYVFFGEALAFGTLPPILIGSSANVIIGAVVWKSISAYRGRTVRRTAGT